MTEPSVEPGPADKINTALVTFAACMHEAVPDICSWGLTLGDTYVPFKPDDDEDCPEDDEFCSQLWVRVLNTNIKSFGREGFGSDTDCVVVMQLSLEVGVRRCFVIPEDGEAPTTTEVLEAATEAMDDMVAIQCKASTCVNEDGTDIFDAITFNQWLPFGPLGGEYGGIWNITVEI